MKFASAETIFARLPLLVGQRRRRAAEARAAGGLAQAEQNWWARRERPEPFHSLPWRMLLASSGEWYGRADLARAAGAKDERAARGVVNQRLLVKGLVERCDMAGVRAGVALSADAGGEASARRNSMLRISAGFGGRMQAAC
jgi:hypothetical protein